MIEETSDDVWSMMDWFKAEANIPEGLPEKERFAQLKAYIIHRCHEECGIRTLTATTLFNVWFAQDSLDTHMLSADTIDASIPDQERHVHLRNFVHKCCALAGVGRKTFAKVFDKWLTDIRMANNLCNAPGQEPRAVAGTRPTRYLIDGRNCLVLGAM